MARFFHGTTSALAETLQRDGVAPAHDAYAQGPATWVTPTERIAKQYAVNRVLCDALIAGDDTGGAYALVVEIDLPESRVRKRRNASEEFYVLGGCPASSIVAVTAYESQPLVKEQIEKFLPDSDTRERFAAHLRALRDEDARHYPGRNGWDDVERFIADTVPGDDAILLSLAGPIAAALSAESLHQYKSRLSDVLALGEEYRYRNGPDIGYWGLAGAANTWNRNQTNLTLKVSSNSARKRLYR